MRSAVCALLHASEIAVAVGGGSTADVSSRRQPQHLSYHPSCLRLGLCKSLYYRRFTTLLFSIRKLLRLNCQNSIKCLTAAGHSLFGTKKVLAGVGLVLV